MLINVRKRVTYRPREDGGSYPPRGGHRRAGPPREEGELASEAAEIGEDEIRVPLTEEEVVVEKRPVAKEEVRIRKDVVSDTETVEEDVRREEIEVEDETSTRRGL